MDTIYRADCSKCKRSIYILDDIYMCNYCGTPEWNKYFKMAYKNPDIKYILCWFDKKILQQMLVSTKRTTLDVRIRIICGLINKNKFLTRDLKIELMELIWKKYKEKQCLFNEFLSRSIYGLPF